jgi:hypothetical protein
VLSLLSVIGCSAAYQERMSHDTDPSYLGSTAWASACHAVPKATVVKVTLADSVAAVRGRVIQALEELGMPPTSSSENLVEWNGGPNPDGLGGVYTRSVGVTITRLDMITVARFGAFERVEFARSGQVSNNALSNRNGGRGLMVWCRMAAAADSLAARMRGTAQRKDEPSL